MVVLELLGGRLCQSNMGLTKIEIKNIYNLLVVNG